MKYPIATAALVLGMVGAYSVESESLCYAHGFSPAHPSFEGALGSLFLHQGLFHLAGNLAFLAVFGAVVELELGSLFLLTLFVAAGLGGAAGHLLVGTETLVGCSGSLFGILAVAGVVRRELLGFMAAFVALNVGYAFFGGAGNVSFSCHLGGFIVGALVVLAMRVMGSEVLEGT